MRFENSATPGVYFLKITYIPSRERVNAETILKGAGLLEFSYFKPTAQVKNEYGSNYKYGMSVSYEHNWIKISPKSSEYKDSKPSSGTGFALSDDGYIVTNNHVINNANTIKVRGVNGNFDKSYNAKIIIVDKNNDLAIIKIDDSEFSSLGTIPYTFNKYSSDVGHSVFVLGYPLRATMGDEIKLTNGIISSKTGFQGDITSYQISAPVQPGNSGGPVFNKNGEIIGIINAKHTGAENASYAVKTSYIFNLIDVLDYAPILPKVNINIGKELSEQVRKSKNFVYIIEVK